MAKYKIVGGPCKRDLELSLFDGNSQGRRKVTFSGVEECSGMKVEANFTINGVAREDGSGESWLINGYLTGSMMPPRRMTGYYSTKTRSGSMEL